MASALFSFIDSIGETFEGVVENVWMLNGSLLLGQQLVVSVGFQVENVVGTVEKEVDSAVQQMDAGVDLDDVLEALL